MDLIRRAIILDEACTTLRMPYTYQIHSDKAKVLNRLELGKLAADAIEVVRNDLFRAGMIRYLQSLGLTEDETNQLIERAKSSDANPSSGDSSNKIEDATRS